MNLVIILLCKTLLQRFKMEARNQKETALMNGLSLNLSQIGTKMMETGTPMTITCQKITVTIQ